MAAETVLIHEIVEPGDHSVGLPDQIIRLHLHVPSQQATLTRTISPKFWDDWKDDEIMMDVADWQIMAAKLLALR